MDTLRVTRAHRGAAGMTAHPPPRRRRKYNPPHRKLRIPDVLRRVAWPFGEAAEVRVWLRLAGVAAGALGLIACTLLGWTVALSAGALDSVLPPESPLGAAAVSTFCPRTIARWAECPRAHAVLLFLSTWAGVLALLAWRVSLLAEPGVPSRLRA